MSSHRHTVSKFFNFISSFHRPKQRASRRGKPKSRLRFERLEAREVFSAGGLDPTFNFGFGKTAADFDNSADVARDMVFQSDGKIVVVGSTNAGGSSHNFAVARFNADGTLDGTFGGMGGMGAGRVATDFSFGHDHAYKAAVLPDGKILVAGTSQATDGTSFFPTMAFARYNPDGTLDNTFGNMGRVKCAEQMDGSGQTVGSLFVLGDKFLVISEDLYVPSIARFNLGDGSVDETFGVGGRMLLDVPIAIQSAALHEDGLVLGGWYDAPDQYDMAFVRIHMDGTIDETFGNQGVSIVSPASTGGNITSIAVQNDGAIVGAGKMRIGDNHSMVVTRLLADGTIDSSFNVDGIYQYDLPVGGHGYFNDVTLAPGGVVVAAGLLGTNGISSYDFAVARLGSDGAPDEAFGPDGLVTVDFAGERDEATSVLSYANGKILLAGMVVDPISEAYDFGLTRLIGVNEPEFQPEFGDLLDPGDEDGFYYRPQRLTSGDDGEDPPVVEDYFVEVAAEDERGSTVLVKETSLQDEALLSFLAEEEDAFGRIGLMILL